MAKNKLESAFFRFSDGNVEWTPIAEADRKNRSAKFRVRVFVKQQMAILEVLGEILPGKISLIGARVKPEGATVECAWDSEIVDKARI